MDIDETEPPLLQSKTESKKDDIHKSLEEQSERDDESVHSSITTTVLIDGISSNEKTISSNQMVISDIITETEILPTIPSNNTNNNNKTNQIHLAKMRLKKYFDQQSKQ